MKLGLLFLLLAWLAWRVASLPDISPRVTRYLIAHALFVLLCIVCLRWDGLGSIRYQQVFYAGAGIVLVLAIAVTARFHDAHPRWLGGLAGAAIVMGAFSVPLVIQHHLFAERSAPLLAGLHLMFAGAWMACGATTLLSLAAPGSVFELRLRAVLGVAWLAHGLFMAALAVGMVRARAFWLGLNDWVPVTVALACFALLGLAVQSEISRQADGSAQRHEQMLLALATERRGQ